MPSPGMSVTVYLPPYVVAALVFSFGNLKIPQVAGLAAGFEVEKFLPTLLSRVAPLLEAAVKAAPQVGALFDDKTRRPIRRQQTDKGEAIFSLNLST